MKVIRGAVDEMWSIVGQMTSSVFRHGLPLTDKIAARTALTNFVLHIHPVRFRGWGFQICSTPCLAGLPSSRSIVLTLPGSTLWSDYVRRFTHSSRYCVLVECTVTC